jgi:hypothetical protein
MPVVLDQNNKDEDAPAVDLSLFLDTDSSLASSRHGGHKLAPLKGKVCIYLFILLIVCKFDLDRTDSCR